MPVFKGNAPSGTTDSETYNIPCYIKSFSFTNLSVNPNLVIAYIYDGSTNYPFFVRELQAGSSYLSDVPIQLKIGDNISLRNLGAEENGFIYYITIE
jgi:hypothetical protein